jgi:hypothetical protein
MTDSRGSAAVRITQGQEARRALPKLPSSATLLQVMPFLWRLALNDPALRVRLGIALVLLCIAKVLGAWLFSGGTNTTATPSTLKFNPGCSMISADFSAASHAIGCQPHMNGERTMGSSRIKPNPSIQVLESSHSRRQALSARCTLAA